MADSPRGSWHNLRLDPSRQRENQTKVITGLHTTFFVYAPLKVPRKHEEEILICNLNRG